MDYSRSFCGSGKNDHLAKEVKMERTVWMERGDDWIC